MAENKRIITWGSGRTLDFSQRTLVMGILNCTPDSFFSSSRKPDGKEAFSAAVEMIEAGADIIDVGGESTRPGSDFVAPEEEIRRVVPVIESIRRTSTIPISIDTRKAVVARAALDAGADIVNDVSALRDDPELAKVVADRGAPVVLMHMRGTPKTMQKKPHFTDTISEIREEIQERIDSAVACGIDIRLIMIDPGIGFGKRPEDNLAIINRIGDFRALGYPVLIGISRKSFIDSVLHKPVDRRLAGTLAAEACAVLNGADILRVHDVEETIDFIRMLNAIRSA